MDNVERSAAPRVAVLLAAYNGLPWLPLQLNTILEQAGVSLDVFISLDKSDDGTKTWLEGFSKDKVNVILLPCLMESFGGAAKNFFRLFCDVCFSDYDYIALSDQDDLWFIDKISRAISELEKNKCDAYSSNVIAFWANGKSKLVEKSQPKKKWDHLFEAAGPGCTYVIRKNLALDIKNAIKVGHEQVSKVYLHDWFIYAYARAKGYNWYIDPKPSLYYRQHANNQLGVNYGLFSALKRYKAVRSGQWFGQVVLMVDIIGLREDSFVKKWYSLDNKGMLVLAFHAPQCRRRLRDQLYLAILCIANIFVKNGFNKQRVSF